MSHKRIYKMIAANFVSQMTDFEDKEKLFLSLKIKNFFIICNRLIRFVCLGSTYIKTNGCLCSVFICLNKKVSPM